MQQKIPHLLNNLAIFQVTVERAPQEPGQVPCFLLILRPPMAAWPIARSRK
jgi:hypothetical protein